MVEAAIHGVKIMGKVLHDNNKLSTGQEKPPFISIWQSITKLFKYSSDTQLRYNDCWEIL